MSEARCKYCSKSQGGRLMALLGQRGFQLDEDWACSSVCLQAMLRSSISRSLDYLVPEVDYEHRVRIGSILVQRGIITSAQLSEAMAAQAEHGGTVGSHILRLGFCSEEELTAGLSEQQRVPWVGVVERKISEEQSRLIPRQLCEDFKVFPFDFDEREEAIFLATRSPARIALVHLIRKMLGLNVRAFLVTDGSFDAALQDYLGTRDKAGELQMQCRRSSREISQKLTEEVIRLGARSVRLARYEEAFWFRLGRRGEWVNCFVSLERPDRVAESDRQSLPEEKSIAL